ncbi:tRNA preQ1(34) S-adenosylmethionine ribosyltransferase-isomerase QueA [Oscillatoria sp. CS-180]|uniref:tRNA preQ1(34) S-adenosylmethionine ribosyltransferase-isomerase QueA n=1 Tax=Oscillatoria sp. CS-180 TaxID=3021720 RepID=UPI00232F8302|nr:tRNA preQ1(34) S-adenosylmethionine ribosyltransferase-isomerase QueA [Oscillatoria sp. CS-180]MDB9524915.1 tRNA preQ1(34) S-adenosylmethionine ribosyltransferase-isomerase QueA [Oscillatoria sp. CS-180]
MGDYEHLDLQLSAYHYELPSECIAQNPVEPRDHARLLTITSATHHNHNHVYDLPELLQPGDLLVLNDTKVLPARLFGRKPEGAAVEILLLEERSHLEWLALVKPGRRLKPGTRIHFGDPSAPPELMADVVASDPETNGRILHFTIPGAASFYEVCDRLGKMPLPPYITNSTAPADRYQTIYAEKVGAVAAPTAGLHFTPELFERLQSKGIDHTFITLHVGVGTFRPVESETITEHKMHAEWLDVSTTTVETIRQTKAKGGRVIAVGTTVTRALEGAAQSGELQPFQGKTNLFIYPGYQWQVLDGLMTNFHLPESSLMMLVSAMIGRKRLLQLYGEAVRSSYRFYSFGDAMLVLPEGWQ